jgi:hypothetical protein
MHQHDIHPAPLQRAGCPKTELQRGTRQIKYSIAEKTKDSWGGKRIHGQFPRNLEEQLFGNERHIDSSNLDTLWENRKCNSDSSRPNNEYKLF